MGVGWVAVWVKASEAGQKSGNTTQWGRRSSLVDPCPQASRASSYPTPLLPLTPGPPSPHLERKPGRSAWEWPVREDESSSLQAAVRGPRPEPWPGAQEATHTLHEARRYRAPGQEKQHRGGGHNAARGPRPAWRPLLAQRRRP